MLIIIVKRIISKHITKSNILYIDTLFSNINYLLFENINY